MVNIPPIKMVIWEMVYYCFTHINTNLILLRLGLSEVLLRFTKPSERIGDDPIPIPHL